LENPGASLFANVERLLPCNGDPRAFARYGVRKRTAILVRKCNNIASHGRIIQKNASIDPLRDRVGGCDICQHEQTAKISRTAELAVQRSQSRGDIANRSKSLRHFRRPAARRDMQSTRPC